MRQIFGTLLTLFLLCFAVEVAAQTNLWRDIYKVKKKDTIYGIATAYGITTDELADANPDMKQPNYKLKKGAVVFIPYAAKKEAEPVAQAKAAKTVPGQKLKVGVLLPLHNVDGDGKRMVEYYRGLLIGCDSLKQAGVSTEIHAFNVNIDADIRTFLLDGSMKGMDIIFGPLYTKQVRPLADFCRANDIKLVIPFSISADDVQTNPQVYQVYQNGTQLNDKAIAAFLNRFPDCNPIFVDCNDTTSQNGNFTLGLRKQLDAKNVSYQITNLSTSEDKFKKAFKKDKLNVVIVNTGRSPELNLTFRKLNELDYSMPGLSIAMFGYTEWLQYESVYRELFHKYEAYVPATFYYYKGLSRIAAFERNYKRWFGTGMQEQYIPRFALTGFDHAQFFLRGLNERGSAFQGTSGETTYKPLQTPLRFRRVGESGGMQNSAFQLVHYKKDGVIESIAY